MDEARFGYLRNNQSEESGIKDKHDGASRHQEHRSGVEFEAGPLFSIIAPEGREDRVPLLVPLPESLGAAKCVLDCDYSEDGLHQEVNAEHLEPGGREDAAVKRYVRLDF